MCNTYRSITTAFLGFLLLLGTSTLAQNLVFDWATQIGGGGANYCRSITTDTSGNVINVGSFQGYVDFDPGAGTYGLTSNGNFDIYIQKLDSNGNFMWANQMGGIQDDRAYSVTTDAMGNIYTTGDFHGTVDFDPGIGTHILTSYGSIDAFIQKLDPNGNLLWVKQIGGQMNNYAFALTIDNSGNIYTTGHFFGTTDFDPSTSTYNLTSNGISDVFILKLDANGNFLWVKQMGGFNQDIAHSITTDSSRNVITTGAFQATVDFDPGVGISNLTSNGNTDIFIQKLDSNGNFLWVKQMGGTLLEVGNAIATDNSGNIYSTGMFRSTVDFDPGVGISNLSSYGYTDTYIQKLDSNGNLIWVKQIGGSLSDSGQGITTDNMGNVFIAGSFQGTVDFDPGIGTSNISSNGMTDFFIQKLDANGNLLWVKQVGGAATDISYTITYDNLGNIYTGGYFYYIVDFDPGAGINNMGSNGSYDGFVLKLSSCDIYTGTDVITACDSYTWIDGNTYTTSNNTAIDTLVKANGCDSIITLDLTIYNTSYSTTVITACDSFTWIDGNTYTTSNNTATDTLTSITGCDSIVALDLTILNTTYATEQISTCDSYTWIDGNTYTTSNNTATDTLTNAAGCDSIITLDLTLLTPTSAIDSVTGCNSYTWIDGNTYTANNTTATYVLTNTAGCDSTVTLHLTIDTLNATINYINGNTLQGTIEGYYNHFEWVECYGNNVYASVAVDSSLTFSAQYEANYALMVFSPNGCIDTSSCLSLLATDVATLVNENEITLFPNPNNGNFTIDFGNEIQNATITVRTINGQITHQQHVFFAHQATVKLNTAKGIYLLEVSSEQEPAKTFKLVVH